MDLSEAVTPPNRPPEQPIGTGLEGVPSSLMNAGNSQQFPFNPKDETCRKLIANFFQNCHPYNMYVYREWFLRDYDAGEGPYYSDTLLFALCAAGALNTPDSSQQHMFALFFRKAEAMALDSLDLPDITILQALIVIGCLAIRQGRSSKGWLYCGMAFRLTHEMGLHLDPNNWKHRKSESSVDREILRRVYWAVFIIDKQLSLYFGRPPALYPQEADVKDTIRIPYPDEWKRLLDIYICKGTSPTAFEDGIPLVACFVHQVELAKILHVMIVDVFENRRYRAAEPSTTEAAAAAAAAAAAVQQVHGSLVRWLSELPQKLHWNQWTVGQVPPYVLHLHMLFHTTMIILHRPPRQHFDDEAVNEGEGIEICYQSLSAILRLLKSYGRYYKFHYLPFDFVQTLASAAEVIMMRRYVDKASWDDKDISRPMTQVLEAMEAVQNVFPCVQNIRESIMLSMRGRETEGGAEQEEEASRWDLDLVDFLQPGDGPFPGMTWDNGDGGSVNSADLGFLVTDDFLNEHYSWNGTMHEGMLS
ncbi:hypothetical protein SLS60_002012 [Paraconiothyrium brasiliense]|uniref:Xylanolytic transcriptional activator regulatory domain-containing protein n=1 Tax=Paraconiothyrium brasiliense TaxID=300254 RepID=A0ABR3S0Y8_9PLEO